MELERKRSYTTRFGSGNMHNIHTYLNIDNARESIQLLVDETDWCESSFQLNP